MKQYYKWSKKYSDGETVHAFYRPNNSGYTDDISQAGIYTEDEIYDEEPIIDTKDKVYNAKYEDDMHNTFAIPIGKVELLGKKIICIRN